MARLQNAQVLGAVTCVQEVLPEMLTRGDRAIFLTTSGSAFHVMPVYTPIGIVMAGLRSYALCLNEVLADKGIYAGTVCLGVLIRKDDPLGVRLLHVCGDATRGAAHHVRVRPPPSTLSCHWTATRFSNASESRSQLRFVV